MPESRSRFILVCQQAFACAVVAAVGVSAVGVTELEIVAPDRQGPALALGPSSVSLVSSAPVEPTVRTVPLAGGTLGSSRLRSESGTSATDAQTIRVTSEVEPVTGFATVGVTWADGQDIEDETFLEIRTRADDVWSEWQEMHSDIDHAPEPGTEGQDVKAGTDAVVVGDVDDVQVRVTSETGSTPEELALAIVDPGEDVAAAEEAPAIDTGDLDTAEESTTPAATYSGDDAVLSTAAARALGVSPKPQIFSRSQWGADERLRDPGSLHYGKIEAGFVHHTVNANNYTKDQVPSILRGIYAYHTQSRGWSDIGYNFLVDRFGQIWEGRYGGVDRAVVGAHTLGYNEESFAMSAIGNFEEAQPSEDMLDSFAELFAWKLSLAGIAADDMKQRVDDSYFAAINGHSDADSTACPGRYLYAKVPEIRKRAAAIQTGSSTEEPPEPTGPGTPLDANLSGSEWPDLVVRDRTTQRAVIVRTHGQLGFEAGATIGAGWGVRDLVVAPGDLDGDGVGDVVARDAASGETDLYLGTLDGAVRTTETTYPRFAELDQLTGVGDFDGQGANDLVGRADTGELYLFPGRGDGTFGRGVVLAADWTAYDLTSGVDDFDGDGSADLVARSGSTLHLVPGLRTAIGTPVALAGSWAGFDVLAGRGDATADGHPDILARATETGITYVYPGDGQGGWTPRVGGWGRYAGISWLTLAGQVAGTRKPDLVGVNPGDELRVFANTGRRNLGTPIDTGVVLDGIDLLLNVGDWDGDGRGDVMTRQEATGVMQLRPGLKGNRLGNPVTAGTGWGSVSRIAAVGDVTGDGDPDLVGRAEDGTDRVYPGNGTTGFEDSYVVARSTVPGRTQVGVGLWDGDTTPDTAVRRTDGTLWLSPTGEAVSQQVADGLRRYDWVRGLGDLDGDDRADLVVRSRATGYLYLLPGRSAGFAPRRLIGTGFEGYDYAG